MHFLKKKNVLSALSFMLVMLLSVTIQAQETEFSDEELEQFADAVTEVMTIQQEGQTEMMTKIEEHDMDVQRFNEINMQAQEMPLDEIEATEEELESFQMINQEIEQIQIELEAELIETIEEQGLSLEKYEAIMGQYQQDPELQQRIQELMQ
ncbi:MAG: DUF4168 domain-containing protein [Bacteroidales bacterium]